MSTAPEERGFLHAIHLAPEDDAARLVYADWLEERGDERADYLRTEVEHQRLLKAFDDPSGASARMLKGLFSRSATRVEESRLKLDEFRDRLDPDWLAAVARVPMEKRHCESRELRFAYECPLRWENLELTDEPAVRHCQTCQRPVHFCQSVEEARAHASIGDCVAVDIACERSEDDLEEPEFFHTLGIIVPDHDLPS